MNEHLTDIDIADYIDDPEASPKRAALEAHVAECGRCREALLVAQQFDAEVDATLMSELMAAARRRADAPAGLMAFARQVDVEEREAREFLGGIVLSPGSLRRAALGEKTSLRTAGVVRLLCEASRKTRETNPQHALTLAEMALSIAEVLPAERYDQSMRAEMRAAAQLERANALRYLGRFDEALAALDASEADYGSTPLPERPLAMVQYVRSVIYMKSERLDEAVRLAGRSADVFRLYGDEDRLVHARMVVACCLFLRKEYGLARALFDRLARQARAIGDALTEARCWNNLANAEREVGQLAVAREHFSEAARVYERLGLATEVVRARWGAADLAVRAGEVASGIDQLRSAADEMLILGLVNDHALAMLGVVRALFAIGQLGELPAICEHLVRVFTETQMPQNAQAALAYLEAAARAGAVSGPLIESLTGYIEREEYATAFVPAAS